MTEDFHAAPVRVLLSVRYGNGIVITYGARALSFDDSGVTVICSEELENGIHLSISAPFIQGITECWVASQSRDVEHAGSYSLELKFYGKVVAIPMGRRGSATQHTAHEQLSAEEIALAAGELAAKLESGSVFPFSRVIHGSTAKRRLLYCAVSAVGVMLLLQEKANVDLSRLIETIRKAAPSDSHSQRDAQA